MKPRADSLALASAPQNPAKSSFGAWLAVAALCVAAMAGTASPALAAKAKPAKQRLVVDTPLTPFQPQVGEIGRFAFTAPGAPAMPQSLGSGFRFTPSGQADNRRALSLGVAARVTTPVVDRSRAAAPADRFVVPAGYNVNLSLGWKGFAVDTGYAHAEPVQMSPLSGRMTDQLSLGLSYGGRNWRTSLQGTAEQSQPLAFAPLTRRYGVELGGAYRVAPRFSVTGGMRYRIAPEPPSLVLPNRDDQAVYLGTSIAF
ncbi:hypothetical protein [Sandarakinorhabdus sp.]|jgi:hypothetical protein|uniref:hypothetical protein n=1 Tax=Sandarakinorhabdus sp. TaxID=1916663 RepID=UPI0028AB0317|nr:hypothetical protein [Sandarakinorhabdus sp.]